MQVPKRIPVDAYFQALEMAAMPVILWSENGILYANRKVSRLTDYENEELLKMHMVDLVAAESLEEWQQTIEILMSGDPGGCSVIRAMIRTRAGEKVEVEMSEAVTTSASGGNIVSTIIHDRNGVQRKLQDHRERLAIINRRVSEHPAYSPQV